MPKTLDRRTFIARGAAVAGGGLLSTTALERLNAANASAPKGRRHHSESYGPLARTPDQRGVEVLALPAGFSYVTFSHSGSTMSDGNPTPLALDGMSAFSGPSRGEVRLVRNSEDRNLPGEGSVGGDPAAKYDPLGGGGTTTLVYDEYRRELGVRLHQPQRHDRELRRRARIRAAQLDHRRGVDRRARGRKRRRALPRASRLSVRSSALARSGRAREGRADPRGRALLPRGGRRRPAPRHRLRDRGPLVGPRRGLLPLPAPQSAQADQGRAAADARRARSPAARHARGPAGGPATRL